jgi:uncharacterized protein YxeA
MSKELFDRLNSAINKFEQGDYNERDFHSTLESIIPSITELEFDAFRKFLSDKEGDLEEIDFMVNQEDRRTEYLKVILQIKDYLINNGQMY